jgi:hypothetical protein
MGCGNLHHSRTHQAGPYWLGSLPSCAVHMISKIHPIKGISPSSSNHPLRFVSCSLRAPTARQGKRVPRLKRIDTVSLITVAAIEAKTTNRVHHQYSDRDARPLKSAYLEKHVLIDSTNVIVSPFIAKVDDSNDQRNPVSSSSPHPSRCWLLSNHDNVITF